jgi:chemotaxis protein CheZ
MSSSENYGRGQVIEIINSVINKIDTGANSRDVFVHIAELAEIIQSLKKDISSHKPEHVVNSHIPDATDELDAVVVATAEATHKIMGVCEEIETIAKDLPENVQNELNARTMQIYEACGFQDITGQRIKNVVTTLRVIEEKIDKIMDTLGNKVGLKVTEGKMEKKISIDDEKSLLNGPQLPAKAITQEDIDKLLAEFDNPN